MARMFTALRRPLVGASFIEYLIIIGGIALVALVGFTQFSESSHHHVGQISKELAGVPATLQGGGGTGAPNTGGAGGATGGDGGAGGGTGTSNPGTPAGGGGSNNGAVSGGSGAGTGGGADSGSDYKPPGDAIDDFLAGGGSGISPVTGGGQNPGGDLGGGSFLSPEA